MSQAQEGSPVATVTEPERVPSEYKVVNANDEARLRQLHPDMAYICGQAPRRPDDVNYEYVKSEMKVFRSTLFALVGNTWLLRDFRYYVRSLTYLGFEATRALLLHLLLYFEKGLDFPLPSIDHCYVSQFFRALRDRDCGKVSNSGPSSQDDLDGEDSDDNNPHAPSCEASDNAPSTRKRGTIDLDVQATLKIYEGAYSEFGYSGFGCRPETMSQLIHYMVKDYMVSLGTHADKNMVGCLRRHIIFDITKDNTLYTGRRRRRRSRKDGYMRANGGGGQTRNQRIARREWWRLVAAGNVPRWKAVERANAVIVKLGSPAAKCDLDDWNKYGAKHSKAKTIAQKLRVIYDTNLDLRKASQSTVALLPLYSASAKFITVDSTALFEVLMEFEKHYSEKRCKTECECCNANEPFKRPTTDKTRFLRDRIRHWLEFVKVPYDLLLKKDEEAEPGRRYFNTMLSTDGFGASLSTFKWVRRKLSEKTPEASTVPPDPSTVESSTSAPTSSAPTSSAPTSSAPSAAESSTARGKRRHTPEPALKIGRQRVVVRVPSPVPVRAPSPEPPPPAAPPTTDPSSSAPATIAPPAPVSKRGRGRPQKSATQPPPPTVESSSVGVKRKRAPQSASTAEGEPVVPRVIARARVRRPGPEPPPPAYLRAMAELAADPYNGLFPASASDEAADAMLAAVADDLAECTAALSELRAVCLASHAEGEAAAHWAASIDRAEYYTEHKRAAIYNEKCEAVTIAYDTAIRVAETAAGPELERTEAQAEALNIARDAAMKTALRGVDVARFVASEAIYAEKRKAAAALDALRRPNHVRIGGDPGVKTFLELVCFDEPEWSCSFSAKQYHADSGSTWRAAEISKLIDRLGLRLWMSRTPTSKTTTSAGTLVLLQYLFKTANFVTHMEMHQKLRVREVRWKAYEQKASTIAEYCRRITVGRKREETTISIGDAKIKNMRGCMPCPRVKKLVDQLRRTGWRAIMAKETNTSQVCSSCMMRLPEGQAPVKLCDVGGNRDKHRFKAKPGNKHFVRRCTVCLKMWNRDINAARNIAYLGWLELLGLPRPWCFVKHLEHPPLRPLQIAYYRDPQDVGSFVLPGDLPPAQATTFEPVYRTPRRLNRRASRLTPLPAQAPPAILLDRPRKPRNERSRWMPTFIQAAKYRQAATEAAGALVKAKRRAKDSPASVKRAAVADKRTSQARAFIAAQL
ncbi:hypothetical protein H4R27_004183 [Coemansia aciculifera]|nr:hypothetical protein H4R27_004183 [Coemansia aciculifera]